MVLSEEMSALLSGVHISPTRPPLQLGSAGSPGDGRRRAQSASRLCQSERREERQQEGVDEQPSAAAEEPHPPAQSGGERATDPALQAQVKKALRDVGKK